MAKKKVEAPESGPEAMVLESPQSAVHEGKAGESAAIWAPISSLVGWEGNPRINAPAVPKVAESIQAFGFGAPLVAQEGTGFLIAGHTRIEAARLLGMSAVPVRFIAISNAKAKALALADNKLGEIAEWDEALLAQAISELQAEGEDLEAAGFDAKSIAAILAASVEEQLAEGPSLADRFLFPPFSVIDTRRGEWQERKRAWIASGLRSEAGRGDALLWGRSDTASHAHNKIASVTASGASIFDPVLAELAYRWFSPKGGLVLDPFAGGSVRGIVAAKLGRRYLGIDLRPEQVAENRAQAEAIFESEAERPRWAEGDSRDLPNLAAGAEADFVFSCPPYADLEKYSKDPRDLSNMPYAQFREIYAEIIGLACAALKPNRFACFVVGDVRDPKGNYRSFPAHTIEAFEAAGLALYCEGILVNAVAASALRGGRLFAASRKLAKVHQNVFVFLKGDAKLATAALGQVEPGADFFAEEEQGGELEAN